MSRSHNARTFNEPLKDRFRLLGRHTTLVGERLPHNGREMSGGPRGFAFSNSPRFPLVRAIFISDLFRAPPTEIYETWANANSRRTSPEALIPASD